MTSYEVKPKKEAEPFQEYVAKNDGIKFFSLASMVFVAYAGFEGPCTWIVEHVKKRLEVFPHESLEEIARAFVHWAGMHHNRVNGEYHEVEFLLFGRTMSEPEPRIIRIFANGNHAPGFDVANASNAASVKVREPVEKHPYVAHVQAMCVIESDVKDPALKSLNKGGHKYNNEKEMRQAAMKAVISACKTTGYSGGDIKMVTVSSTEPPSFHESKVQDGTSTYGRIKKSKWKPL